MKSYSDKNQEKQRKSTAARARNKNNQASTCQFVDNRPKAIQMRKLQKLANNSSQVQQLKALQEMANNSPRVKQLQAISKGNMGASSVHPVTQLQLAPGWYKLKNIFFKTNLRRNDRSYTVKAKLKPGEEVEVIPNGGRVSKFGAGWRENEHSWVKTENNGEGWIEDSMLKRINRQIVHSVDSSEESDLLSHDESSSEIMEVQTVDRLLPDLQLPPEKKEWNFGQDEAGERRYNEIKRLINALERLQQYQNDHPPSGRTYEYEAQKGGVQSDYHRHGEPVKAKFYEDATSAGYDLTDKEVRRLLDNVAGLYHSHTYESLLTTTGNLLW